MNSRLTSPADATPADEVAPPERARTAQDAAGSAGANGPNTTNGKSREYEAPPEYVPTEYMPYSPDQTVLLDRVAVESGGARDAAETATEAPAGDADTRHAGTRHADTGDAQADAGQPADEADQPGAVYVSLLADPSAEKATGSVQASKPDGDGSIHHGPTDVGASNAGASDVGAIDDSSSEGEARAGGDAEPPRFVTARAAVKVPASTLSATAAVGARAVAQAPANAIAKPPAGGHPVKKPKTGAKGTARVRAAEPAGDGAPAADATALITRPVVSDDTSVIPRIGGVSDTTVIPRVEDADLADRVDATAVFTKIKSAVLASPDASDGDAESGTASPAIRPSRLGQAPTVLAISAVGVVLVALSYAGGRSGASWANAAYWLGQVVVFAPVAARMFFGRLAGTVESFTLVIGLAVMQYMQKWLYTPDQFKFPDELQHWSAANTLVQTGRLFQPDRALPVAVHFPGLEVMTSAVVTMTGLPITAAGLIVAGVAHLTFIGALYMLIRRTGGSPELAGAACVIYATALHYVFFDSMFIYQTAALPFMMLAIWASRLWRPREWKKTMPYALVMLVGIVGATASHHVTAGALVATLGLIGLCEVIFSRPRRWGTLIAAAVAALVVAVWFVLVAPEVFGYLGPPLEGMISGVKGLLGAGGSSTAGSAPPSPKWQLGVQALGLIVLLWLLFRAVKALWRAPGRVDAYQAALIAGSLAFFASNGARFVGAQGPELAGRASTFAYVPMAIVAASVLVGWRARPRPPQRLHLDRFVPKVIVPPIVHGTLIAILLMVGARVGGWPPVWEALPGPYLVSGFERSVDSQSVAAAQWTFDWLGPDHRFAADQGGMNLVSTYGDQDPVGEASKLYYDPAWNLDDELLLQSLGIDYLWVDIRISEQLPASGAYFPVDPQNGLHTRPIPRANLTKFDGVSGANRVYDNGDITIYDMRTA